MVDSLLMAISYHMPDPLPMLGALSHLTDRINLLLAYRPGLLSPTLFTQVVNTVSWMSDNRINLNIVAGISPRSRPTTAISWTTMHATNAPMNSWKSCMASGRTTAR
ncbi:hypothetical protein Shyd_56670 [Streptomyces hydrogenans]|uniref:Luciferase-like domain-containing protein n=1 Tax=Streptomyces hydrogenans TaxID=1873719 RepID=A0ABQ3PH06_9ACTN|nr:LLM class flavin-dependent oxidoreductase [Streptomyces hydrogenans]GHI24296.1 hypothetical protein Shyd_56670 [Streptomyces hydrogenans]